MERSEPVHAVRRRLWSGAGQKTQASGDGSQGPGRLQGTTAGKAMQPLETALRTFLSGLAKVDYLNVWRLGVTSCGVNTAS